MLKKIFFFFVYCYVTFCGNSYAQRLIYDHTIPVEKIRVVLEQTQGGKVSEMLTELEYIPLKGGKADLVDYVSDIAIHGDKIGIISGNNKGYFYLYNIDGTLVKKITKIDGFKSPYPDVKQLFFDVSKEGDNFVLGHGLFKARVDLRGNIVDTSRTSQEDFKDDGFGQYVQEERDLGTEAKYKFYSLYQNEKRKKQDILSFNDSILISYNPLDTIKHYYTSAELSKVYKDKFYMTSGYNTKIFELDNAGIRQIYELVLPLRNTFDFKQATALKEDDHMKIYHYFNANNDKVYGLRGIVPYGDYLMFLAQRFHNPMWLAYNLKTKETYGLDNIIPDASNDYLDFFDVNKVFVEGDFFYSFIFPSQIHAAQEKCQLEGHKMRKEYADLAKYNNPILVRFKLK